MVPALLCICVGWNMLAKSLASKRWPAVKGKIVTKKIAKEKRSVGSASIGRKEKTVYRPVVVYGYEVKGKYYTGQNEYPEQEFEAYDHIGEAQHHMRKWESDKKADVYVNPEDHAQSCLKTGLTILPIVLLLVGAGFATIAVANLFAIIHAIMS